MPSSKVAGHQTQAHVVSCGKLGVPCQARVRLHVVDGGRVRRPLKGDVRARGVDDLWACGVLQGDGRRGAVVLLGPHRGRAAHHASLSGALFQGRGALEAVLQGRGALKGLLNPLSMVHGVLGARGA